MELVIYCIVFPLLWLISLMPLRVLYAFSDFVLYPLVYHVAKYRRKVVYDNLRKSFPEKSEAEIATIAKKFYKHFGHILVETVKLINISKAEVKKRIRYRNPELFFELFEKGKSIVAVTAHYGNWEWLVGVPENMPCRVLSLYKPLSNKHIEKMLTRMRTQFGAELVTMEDAPRILFTYKQNNVKTLSCFISDQTPIRSRIHYQTQFLNQVTPVFLGPEKMARKLKTAVVFVKMIPVKTGYYDFEIVPIAEDASLTNEHEITERHVKILEEQIKEHPEFWLWTHRRWKYQILDKDVQG